MISTVGDIKLNKFLLLVIKNFSWITYTCILFDTKLNSNSFLDRWEYIQIQ